MWAPLDKSLRILYGGPLRSVSSLTIEGPPQISFFATIWGPLRSVSSHTIWGPPQTCFFAYYMGPPQISFFAYYMGPPSGQFLRLLWGPPSGQFLRLLWGPFDLKKNYALNYPYFFNFGGGGASVPSCPPPCGRPCM